MAVHAFFTYVQEDHNTERRQGDGDWLEAKVGHSLKGGDKSRYNPPDTPNKNYTVNLCSNSQVMFEDGKKAFTLDSASGRVFVTDDPSHGWNEVDTDTLPQPFTNKFVATDSDSSVSIDVTNGSRGVYGPPQW
jgi:hypothetical protein